MKEYFERVKKRAGIIILFGNTFDKQLTDPVWETVSLKIKKYSPFINIDVFNYKKILRSIIDE